MGVPGWSPFFYAFILSVRLILISVNIGLRQLKQGGANRKIQV
jgi:hypothetical protein